MKVADNILVKLKNKSEEKQFQGSNTMVYILINFVSFAYICSVILQLKKEEEQKENKAQMAKDKLQKISPVPNKKPKEEPVDERGRKKMHILPPTSIGTKVDA